MEKVLAVCVALACTAAVAEEPEHRGVLRLDRPTLLVVPRPQGEPLVLELPHGYFLTDRDWEELDQEVKAKQAVDAQNAKLREKLAEPPEVSWTFIGVLLLIGAGVGAGATLGVQALKK